MERPIKKSSYDDEPELSLDNLSYTTTESITQSNTPVSEPIGDDQSQVSSVESISSEVSQLSRLDKLTGLYAQCDELPTFAEFVAAQPSHDSFMRDIDIVLDGLDDEVRDAFLNHIYGYGEEEINDEIQKINFLAVLEMQIQSLNQYIVLRAIDECIENLMVLPTNNPVLITPMVIALADCKVNMIQLLIEKPGVNMDSIKSQIITMSHQKSPNISESRVAIERLKQGISDLRAQAVGQKVTNDITEVSPARRNT